MSESVEYMKASKAIRKALRAAFGQPCPECVRLLPKAQPTILLPGHVCRIHQHKDARPELTQTQINTALQGTGYEVKQP